MDRNEFAKLLYGIEIPGKLSYDECSLRYQPLINYLNAFFSKTLYRYRNCEERNIDAFYRDQIWASNGECMNDGFDARIFFDRSSVEKEIEEGLSEDSLNKILSFMKAENAPFSGIISQFDESELYKSLVQFKETIRYDISNLLNDVVSVAQSSFKFVCFSESIVSAAMWGLYSGNESGFALAYNFNKFSWGINDPNNIQETFSLFPVVYANERFKIKNNYIHFLVQRALAHRTKAPRALIEQSFPCPDNFMTSKIALSKSSEWSYEKEWRIIYTKNDSAFQNSKNACFELSPSAIYLGRRISYINERILIDIAREKGIQIYKMKLNDELPTYDLIPIQIK